MDKTTDDRSIDKIDIGDFVICGDLVGQVVAVQDTSLLLRDKTGAYRSVARRSKNLALIVSAYAHCALVYNQISGGQ